MGDLQATVQHLIDGLVESGDEDGLQVAVYHRGELVVDVWAGVADRAMGTPVDAETLFTVYSVSKGITATALHILAERGAIDYDATIASHWPGFAANGKAEITVRQALSHLSGIPALPEGTTTDDILDWAMMCERMETLTPIWEPGTTLCYHAMTCGWIWGGLMERADGRSFRRIVNDEIIAPLGLTGLYFGVPDAALSRVATMTENADLKNAEPGMVPNVVPPGAIGDEQMNRREVRQACLPSYGVCANARSLAAVYAALIGDGVDGVRLLPPERVARATEKQIEAIDAGSGMIGRFALGYGVGGTDSTMGPRASAFGHGGYGGAMGYADPDYGLAVGLTKNRLIFSEVGQGTSWTILKAIRAGLGIPETVNA